MGSQVKFIWIIYTNLIKYNQYIASTNSVLFVL